MKRGKDDERMMGPMFPRLHVNDTEKGGPRAPPRNKMALYEQLSIPSQRFNSGLLPHNSNNTSTVVPPASPTQGSDNKRAMFFPVHVPRSTRLAEKSNASSSDYNASLIAPKKKVDEEDFMVPIFVQSEKGQNLSKNSDSLNREKLPLSSPVHVSNSVRNQSSCGEEQKQASTKFFKLRQSDRTQNEENSKEFVGSQEQSVKYAQGVLAIEKTQGSLRQTDASKNQEDRDHLVNDLDRIHSSYALHHEVINSSQSQIGGTGHSFIPSFFFPEEQGNLNDSTLGGGYSLGIRNGDGCDNDTDTSMVDSVSGVDISPDDVVGIIGQKHFWKARRVIVNQQRVFAVQVFELHRLIKVQRLFADSPHLLLEDVEYLGKPLKASPTKELSLEFIVKPNLNTVKRKDDNKNPGDKMEGSAENAVGETPLSVQNVSQISNQRPFSANPVSTPVSSDTKMNPWDFPQPSGNQWLIPVMSPTEGLIYKPYSKHTGSNPMMGNFINSPYGIQNSHPYYQGFGVPPGFPLVHHGYFPPYGMPVAGPAISGSAVDQGNYFAGQGLHGCLGPLSGPGVCSTKEYQNSCNASTQKKNETSVPNVIKMKIGKESELQMSTASSPGEGRNGLPLFPTSPAVDVNSENRGRVIKVVPHNAMSTNESAFRIFQSIQEERKQYDSV